MPLTALVGGVVRTLPRRQPGSRTALARRFEVEGVPTLLLIDLGQTVSRQTGAAPAHVLKPWVDSALARRAS